MAYGYTTIFVAVFPLAPLFALLNHALKLRLDARKLTKFYRRSVPVRAKSIGKWLDIIEFLGNLSTLTNALIIAYGSKFVPFMVYVLNYRFSEEYTNSGYLNFTLSTFSVNDLEYRPHKSAFPGLSSCRYLGFRTGPDDQYKYSYSLQYWHVLAAKLVFVIFYVNVINILKWIVNSIIPRIPRTVRRMIRNQNKLLMEYLIQTDASVESGTSIRSVMRF